jgi:hypothetical protein
MPRIHREVIEHKLGIDPSYKPVKQKERSYTLERRETIQQEVDKLLEAGFIRPVDYPSWLANLVLVEKPALGACALIIQVWIKHIQKMSIPYLVFTR